MTGVPLGVFAAVGIGVLVVVLVLAAVLGLRHQQRRRDDWSALAARRGLTFVDGDPFDLAYAVGGRVRMTLHGPDGAPRFAVVGVEPAGNDLLVTVPAAVAWTDDVPGGDAPGTRRFDHPRLGQLLVWRPAARWRGTGTTASAAEAERLLDEVGHALRR